MSYSEPLTCEAPDCTENIAGHAWGKIKADGWFQQKDDKVWCPKHIPSWVKAWRRKQLDARMLDLRDERKARDWEKGETNGLGC